MQDSPSLNRWVELPRDVGGSEDENSGLVVSNSVHLDEELCKARDDTTQMRE